MVLISSTHIKQVDKSKQTIVIYQNKVYDVTKFVTIHPGNLLLFSVSTLIFYTQKILIAFILIFTILEISS